MYFQTPDIKYILRQLPLLPLLPTSRPNYSLQLRGSQMCGAGVNKTCSSVFNVRLKNIGQARDEIGIKEECSLEHEQG